MGSDYFYSDLPLLSNFIDIAEPANFFSVPEEWYILITDIVGSTKAIEAGRYKDVNLIGACSIIAILNIAGNIEIPFVFGGDGASILIPPSLFVKAKQALLGTQYFAKKEFDLELRSAIVPVSAVNEANYELKIAKVKVSDKYNQGIFTGGGLTYATQLSKDVATADRFNIQNIDIPEKPNFTGLTCAWQDIFSPYGEAVSLLVMATVNDFETEDLIYKKALEEIYKIYGDVERFHPIMPGNMKIALENKNISRMVKIQSKTASYLRRLILFVRTTINLLVLALSKRFKNKVGWWDWKLVEKSVVADSDYRKFDDMLRMVIAGDATQRSQLESYLEKNYQAGKLVYGIHVSDRVLMTCMVPLSGGREVHLIDGADGGYALAAKDMKARLAKTYNK